VQARYYLINPVIGFCHETKKVVVVPEGGTIILPTVRRLMGLCLASWNGRMISVYPEDVGEHGLPEPEIE
jgi:hypothetical protein